MFCIYWKSFLEGLFAKLCGSRVGIGGCVGAPRRVVCRGDNCPGNWGVPVSYFSPWKVIVAQFHEMGLSVSVCSVGGLSVGFPVNCIWYLIIPTIASLQALHEGFVVGRFPNCRFEMTMHRFTVDVQCNRACWRQRNDWSMSSKSSPVNTGKLVGVHV